MIARRGSAALALAALITLAAVLVGVLGVGAAGGHHGGGGSGGGGGPLPPPGSVAVDPSSPQNVYAAVLFSGGVIKTTTGGP